MSYDRFVYTVGYFTAMAVVALSALTGMWVAASLGASASDGLGWGTAAGVAVLGLGLLGDRFVHVGPVTWSFWLADLRADRKIQATAHTPAFR